MNQKFLFFTIDILAIIYLLLFIYIIKRCSFFNDPGLPGWWFPSVFILKVAAGTFLAAIYTYYYTDRLAADIYKYFDDSKIMYDALWQKPGDYFRMLTGTDNNPEYFNTNYYNIMNNWFRKYETGFYNDSHTIIRINAFLHLFSFGSYHVHTVITCFLSLSGLTALYRVATKVSSGKNILLAIVVFLFPSVLFWGSGVLKESFLLAGLGFFIYGFYLLINRNTSVPILIFMLCGLILLLYLKVYVLLALLPGMAGYAWVHFSGYKKVLMKHIFILLLLIAGAASLQYIIPQNKIYHMLDQKQQDFINLSESVQSGSTISIPELEPNFLSFAKAVPLAFFNVLVRPFPGESFSPLILFASLENLLIITGILLIFIYFKKPLSHELNLILMCASFVILLFILIGWVTPVVGAIVRYKVPALPFLGIILVMLVKNPLLNQPIPNNASNSNQ